MKDLSMQMSPEKSWIQTQDLPAMRAWCQQLKQQRWLINPMHLIKMCNIKYNALLFLTHFLLCLICCKEKKIKRIVEKKSVMKNPCLFTGTNISILLKFKKGKYIQSEYMFNYLTKMNELGSKNTFFLLFSLFTYQIILVLDSLGAQ